MSTPKLSEGSLKVIMQGGDVDNPIMQILGSKKIASGSSDKERYRVLLSDGKNLISFAMLSTQINDLIRTGELVNNSIIKLKKYITSVINNVGKGDKRVLVILELELLVPGNKVSKIGSPEQIPDSEIVGNTEPGSTNCPTLRASHAAMNMSLQEAIIHPISSLSPYQNRWVIKARVTNKSPIRSWSNAKGEGKLFSMDLIDESGEIRATAFKDLVDRFYDMIEVDKVYYFSKCQLKLANKQYTSLKNEYEMTLTNETSIQECFEETNSIPKVQYNFVPIDKISEHEVNSIIDVIGVCKSAGEVTTIIAKSTGRELKKRELQLVDQTNVSIDLTLWGTEAENFDGSSQPVVAIKAARIGEFGGGKNVSILSSSIFKINPDIPESHKLRGWFDNGGLQSVNINLSARSASGGFSTPWIDICDVSLNKLGNAERGDYYQVKATILLIKTENSLYKACPKEECNKKVVDLHNGMYRCEKCNREYTNFKYRLIMMMNVADATGNQWLNMFNSEAEKILGMTSNELGEAIESDANAYITIADQSNFKQFVFKCRAKMEVYNDESRLRTTALNISPINYKEYNAQLISKIQKFIST